MENVETAVKAVRLEVKELRRELMEVRGEVQEVRGDVQEGVKAVHVALNSILEELRKSE